MIKIKNFCSYFTAIQRLYDTATIHTVFGDIQVALFKECQKTVENFCVHSMNGYYNSNIFHRVIKGFMIQTGDPTGKSKIINDIKNNTRWLIFKLFQGLV